MSNNHKTNRVHVDKSGSKKDVYTSGKYKNDFHLKDGTPVKINETSHRNNVFGSNKSGSSNHASPNIPSGDEWGDYAHTSDDL